MGIEQDEIVKELLRDDKMIEMIAMIGLEVRVAFRRDSFSSYPHILSSSGAMRVKLACPPIYRKNVTSKKSPQIEAN